MPSGSSEVPNWILISVAAPLIVACLGVGGANIVTVAVLKSTVIDLKDNAVRRTYVKSNLDRLHEYIDFRVQSVKQTQSNMEKQIKTNRARSADNADRINEMRRTRDAIWRVPMKKPRRLHKAKRTGPLNLKPYIHLTGSITKAHSSSSGGIPG